MTSLAAKAPQKVRDYFWGYHPEIRQIYNDEVPGGWRSHPQDHKRLSERELMRLRKEGYSLVALAAGSHEADYTIDELLAMYRKERGG